MRVNRDKISNLITQLRKSRNYSQQDMARFLGVSERTVRNWEKGITLPSMEDVACICDSFKLSFNDFINGVFTAECKQENDTSGGSDIEMLDRRVSNIEEAVNILGDVLIESGYNSRHLLCCLELFLLHAVTALINYRLFYYGIHAYLIQLAVTAVYVTLLVFMVLKNRKNLRFLVIVIMYLCVLFVNTVILTSLYDSSFSIHGFLEFFAFNGPLYGLITFRSFDFIALLTSERIVYIILILICLFVMKFKERIKTDR